MEPSIKEIQLVFKAIKYRNKAILLFSTLLLFEASCNSFPTSENNKNDTLYIFGYFYPKESFYVAINGKTVFDSTMSQKEYFEFPVVFTAKDSSIVECNLSYNCQKRITRMFRLGDIEKKYMIIIPIGVPLGYQQIDTTKPPPFDKWEKLSPDSLQREIKLDFKGRQFNY